MNEHVKCDASEQPGRMARQGVREKEKRVKKRLEGGNDWERTRLAGEVPSVHCYSRLPLNIVAVVSKRTEGGTGGTLANWGTHIF